jgi:hypothetical protein
VLSEVFVNLLTGCNFVGKWPRTGEGTCFGYCRVFVNVVNVCDQNFCDVIVT